MAYTEQETSKYTNAGDLRIHYNEAGDGLPLLYVHGGGPGATGWSNFSRSLQVMAPEYRCLLIDLPLFGKSDRPEQVNGSRMEYFAGVLRNFLDSLGIDRVTLVGNSLGGASCAKFAINYPEYVENLVIMGGGGTVSFDRSKPELLGDGIVALAKFLQEPTREAVEHLLSLFVYDFDGVPKNELEERISLALRPDMIAAQRTLFGDPDAIEDLTDQLSKITARTFLLWGREDRFIPLWAGLKYLEGIKNSEMHVFPRCGHWVMIEREREFNRLLKDFLSV